MTELEAEDSPATEQMAHPPHLSHSALSHMQQALAGRRADLVKHWLAVHTTFQKRKNDVEKIKSKSSKNYHRYAVLTALIWDVSAFRKLVSSDTNLEWHMVTWVHMLEPTQIFGKLKFFEFQNRGRLAWIWGNDFLLASHAKRFNLEESKYGQIWNLCKPELEQFMRAADIALDAHNILFRPHHSASLSH